MQDNRGPDIEAAPASVTVEVTPAGDGARVLRMTGELDVATAPELQARVPELVEGAAGLVLDLAAVTFFDSSGVRMVDRFARECGRSGVAFAVVARPGTAPSRVLEIVGFGPPLVTADLAAGLAAVADPA